MASEFVAHLLDLLAPLGGVTARSMFGGWGFHRGGIMFALVAFETFFVKVDEVSRSEFAARGLAPFAYPAKDGTHTVMSYRTVPADALETSDALCEWAKKGIAAAERAALAKTRGRKSKAEPKRNRQPNRGR